MTQRFSSDSKQSATLSHNKLLLLFSLSFERSKLIFAKTLYWDFVEDENDKLSNSQRMKGEI